MENEVTNSTAERHLQGKTGSRETADAALDRRVSRNRRNADTFLPKLS
jgi:hypothetical protein